MIHAFIASAPCAKISISTSCPWTSTDLALAITSITVLYSHLVVVAPLWLLTTWYEYCNSWKTKFRVASWFPYRVWTCKRLESAPAMLPILFFSYPITKSKAWILGDISSFFFVFFLCVFDSSCPFQCELLDQFLSIFSLRSCYKDIILCFNTIY